MNSPRHSHAPPLHRSHHPIGPMVVLMLLLAMGFGTALAAGTSPAPAAGVGNRAVPPPGAPGIPEASPLATSMPDFGNGLQVTVLHAASFTPYSCTIPLAYAGDALLDGYMEPYNPEPGDLPNYQVQIQLPNGAEVTWASVILYDSYDAGSVLGEILVYEQSTTPETVGFFMFDSGEAFDGGHLTLGGTLAYPFLFRTWGDPDENGTAGNLAWVVRIAMRVSGGSFPSGGLAFWSIILGWHRTVSPAPATATFDDVPTGHWAFQFVEALAASGITAGCGGGNYCPDDPVTRGQMAVYLSAALGLHWPT